MASRKVPLVPGEYFHVYNRGVDGRPIIQDEDDLKRLLTSMRVFNRIDPVGSLYEFSFQDQKEKLGGQVSKLDGGQPLVSIVSFNILPNHLHFIMKPLVEKGGSEYMKRVMGGFTMFFNEKNGRTGPLVQSPFKSAHIRTDHHLLQMQAYVNLNDYIHGQGKFPGWLGASSWNAFTDGDAHTICDRNEIKAILSHFPSRDEYKKRTFDTADAVWQGRMQEALANMPVRDAADQVMLDKYQPQPLGGQVSK